MKPRSLYAGSCIVLPTQHAKSIAMTKPFQEMLGANVLEYLMDTDQFGTFSGEIERDGNALDCARRKCVESLKNLGDKVEFALASEGSFGPHPYIPLLPCDQEILYFIDRRHGFHLHMSCLSEKTNYRTATVDSFEALQKFAEDARFPSHALIVRPNNRAAKTPIFKGIDSWAALENAYTQCRENASDGKVWVETDMRAHLNPSRMEVIGELAMRLAERLATHCPKCSIPGWGKVRVASGLECRMCGSATNIAKAEIFGCVKCDFEEIANCADRPTYAEPVNCSHCNP